MMSVIRPATPSDGPTLAGIHVRSLPEDLLPRLGVRYLEGVFYALALASPEAFTLVAETDGVTAGFVLFSYRGDVLTASVKRRWLSLLAAVFRQTSSDPTLPLDLASLCLQRKIQYHPGISGLEELPELYLIALDAPFRGYGLGGAIVMAGLQRLARQGYGGCIVKTASRRAVSFYKGLGFTEAGSESRRNRILTVLHHSLSNTGTNTP